MQGMFAVSKAGHDKGKFYIIIKEENEYVYLVDGKLRPIENPKKKKKKHIQIIKKTDAGIALKIIENRQISNEEIKHALKLYVQETI